MPAVETDRRGPLTPLQRWTLAAWAAVAVAMAGIFWATGQTDGAWSDLVAVVIAMFLVASLATVGLAYVVARLLPTGSSWRTVTAVAGPPGIFLIGWLILWLL